MAAPNSLPQIAIIGQLWLTMTASNLQLLKANHFRADRWRTTVAGPAWRASVASRRLNLPTKIWSLLGADAWGDAIRCQLNQQGVDISQLQVIETACPQIEVIIKDQKTSRLQAPKIAIDKAHDYSKLLYRTDWLMLDYGVASDYQISEIMHQARLNKVKIILQIDNLDRSRLDRLDGLLEDVNWLIMSQSALKRLGRELLDLPVKNAVASRQRQLIIKRQNRQITAEFAKLESGMAEQFVMACVKGATTLRSLELLGVEQIEELSK